MCRTKSVLLCLKSSWSTVVNVVGRYSSSIIRSFFFFFLNLWVTCMLLGHGPMDVIKRVSYWSIKFHWFCFVLSAVAEICQCVLAWPRGRLNDAETHFNVGVSLIWGESWLILVWVKSIAHWFLLIYPLAAWFPAFLCRNNSLPQDIQQCRQLYVGHFFKLTHLPASVYMHHTC